MSKNGGDTLSELLRERYRQALDLPAEHWNEVLASLLAHRSVRAFRAEPLPEGVLETLVAAAQSASTSSNLQSWSVVAVRNPERKQRLSRLAADQAWIRECPLFLVWLADLSRAGRVGERLGQRPGAIDFLETALIAIIDATLAAQNAMAAAESLGLGGVFIGGIRNAPVEVAAELGLPPHVFPVFGHCIGFPDSDRPASVKPRLPQAAILHHERYEADTADAALPAYDEALALFQREQGMKVVAWQQQTTGRLAGPQSMAGRHLIRDAFSRLGFPLR